MVSAALRQTMEQLKAFNSGELLGAQRKLTETWDPYQKTVAELNQQTVASEEAEAEIQAKILLPIIRQKQLQRDIDLLVDFFDNLQICVQRRICDEAVAQAFFGDYARNFYRLHQPWNAQQRAAIPSYACQLQVFAVPDSTACP